MTKVQAFSDTLIRKTLFFSNIPIALSPKLTRSCIIISGFLLKGLFYTEETGVFKIDDESQAEIYMLFVPKSYSRRNRSIHCLFIHYIHSLKRKKL